MRELGTGVFESKDATHEKVGFLGQQLREHPTPSFLCGGHSKGKKVRAMVDNDASYNFLNKKLTRDLELREELCEASIKVVNSKATSMTGMASKVPVQLG